MKTLTTTIGCVCVALTAIAVARDPQVEKADGKRRLSEALPEKLGAFVLNSGADRHLTVPEAIGVGKLLGGEADLDTIVQLLRPAEVVEYRSKLTIVGVAEGRKPGDQSHAGQPQLIAVSNIILDNGVVLEVGDGLLVGDRIALGFVINTGKNEVILASDAGDEIVIGVGVLLNAGGCGWTEHCDAAGNCTNRCEGTCKADWECLKVTRTNDDGSTDSWCACVPPKR